MPATPVDRRLLLGVLAIAAVGLVARLVYSLAVVGDAPLVGDALEFQGLARSLADGEGYVGGLVAPGQEPRPTAHKPPLYPLVLAGANLLGAGGTAAHHAVSALLGTATVIVVALLTARLAGRRAALIAAGLAAAYPVLIAMDATLRSESLYVLLVAATLLVAHRAWERPTTGRLAGLGALVGLAALTRSEGLALLVLVAAPVAWLARSERRASGLAIVAGSCALVLAPWLVRCWIAFDQPVAISTSYGDLIAGANCAPAYSGPLRGEWLFTCVLGERGADEADVADKLRARGVDYARDHAGDLPAVLVARAGRPWGLYDPAGEIRLHADGEGRNVPFSWLGLGTAWLLVVLAVGGVVVLRRRGAPLFILLAPFVLVLLLSLTSYGTLRFRAAADIAIVVLAAVALSALVARRRPLGIGPDA